jgi:hypothetical protein
MYTSLQVHTWFVKNNRTSPCLNRVYRMYNDSNVLKTIHSDQLTWQATWRSPGSIRCCLTYCLAWYCTPRTPPLSNPSEPAHRGIAFSQSIADWHSNTLSRVNGPTPLKQHPRGLRVRWDGYGTPIVSTVTSSEIFP